ncbi:(E)-4-hydroxy-3-methylbut-2-enyl-diphosphate synthase, partial [Megasphaera sp. DJF_B143]|uniref:(E)-4-hydroxy-3-methylbut-2-enyl-diphosphate synthase n=1 Tax=Megasphaera sp. DJF_B143 TaxID=537288 RepID=UPI0012433358
MTRRTSRPVTLGTVTVGGTAPVSVQTMSTVNPADTDRAIADVQRLSRLGAEIIRFAVPDKAAALALKDIVASSPVPLVADIHFDYRLALLSVESGVQALRINPGNIGADEHVVKVVEKVRPSGIPIRIGINSGSLPEDILQEYGGHPTADGMVEGALRHIRILEKMDYRNMVISLKSSQVPLMIEAYEKLAEKVPYAFHLGVTEAGLARVGTIKSAIGIGTLLYKGIGDTIRVSLTDDPAEEIKVGQDILSALGLRQFGPVLIS